jgi:hypothetical protein
MLHGVAPMSKNAPDLRGGASERTQNKESRHRAESWQAECRAESRWVTEGWDCSVGVPQKEPLHRSGTQIAAGSKGRKLGINLFAG